VFCCVLESEGCTLVPRSSGTPVATWAWPIWVVSRRRVLEAVFILLKFPSPSRRIFIGSHSLPPLWFAVSVLHIGPNHEQKEHIQHITHKLNARSQILITRSSQTPTNYLMSCQSHRAMCPLLDMRLLIGEHHATI
jgi:hypothetical protein